MIHNVNCTQAADLRDPSHFHPYHRAEQRKARPRSQAEIEQDRELMRRAFLRK